MRRIAGSIPRIAGLAAIVALPQAAVAEPSAPPAGRAVYEKWCAPCHDPGINHPGTHALMAKYQGLKPAALLDWTDLQPATVRYMVRHGISVMPHFRKTEISDTELEALASYLSRNSPHP
jgi:mono/diheme cytochrome c family protein